jgi:uncharacterized protein (TIGR04255 family)
MPGLTKFPNFEKPPVIEVVLSAQFVPVDGLTAAHLGLLWTRFRKDFPAIEQHGPVEHAVESFGQMVPLKPSIMLQLVDSPPTPRCWFKNDSGTELIQVQVDRFMHNWRKTGEGDQYPRYEHIRKRFGEELRQFESFINEEKLGRLVPDQCEVTYINHIASGEGWQNVGELGNILNFWKGETTEGGLSEPEEIKVTQKYVISDSAGKPAGRLHVDVQSAFRASDRHRLYVLTLTARTKPVESTIDGVLGGLDLGRENIVKSFVALTTLEIRKVWVQKDES